MTTLTEEAIEDIKLDAQIEHSDHEKRKEAERRKAFVASRQGRSRRASTRSTRRPPDWNDERVCAGDATKGPDTKALWAAIRGFEELHRDQSVRHNRAIITRWFVSWVKNRLIAEINTLN